MCSAEKVAQGLCSLADHLRETRAHVQQMQSRVSNVREVREVRPPHTQTYAEYHQQFEDLKQRVKQAQEHPSAPYQLWYQQGVDAAAQMIQLDREMAKLHLPRAAFQVADNVTPT